MEEQKQVKQEPTIEPKENQISEDLKMVKGFKDKVFGKVKPPEGSGIPKDLGKLSDPNLLKKVLRVAVIVILLIALLFIVSRAIKMIGNNGSDLSVIVPTPTVAQYRPTNPSIYADDPEVLKIEEDIKILDRELSTAVLPEPLLVLPILDFDIDFED